MGGVCVCPAFRKINRNFGQRFTRKYSPDEPRIPAGNGRESGQWTDGGGAVNPDSTARKPASQFSISKNGVNFIISHEAFKPHVYIDDAGHPTIGYGHELQPGESYPAGITKDQAQQLLQQDLSAAENAVRNNVTVGIAQNQFDAFTALT